MNKLLLPLSGFLLAACTVLAACTAQAADEQTLQTFSRAHETYSQGMLQETVELLKAKNTNAATQRFIPSLILRGKAEYFSGNIQSAEKTFRKVLKLNSAQSEAQIYLSRILIENYKDDEAKKILQTMLANDPNNISALRLSAELAKDGTAKGNVEAAAFLDRAVAITKENAFLFLDRAQDYWIMGKNDEALANIEIAKSLTPLNGSLYKTLSDLENTISNN
ncbi:MAG: hypothetical protein Ta2G_04300 [Termitinemataceae bacterium]|nr:MAG: hypothetical protein Ta2G_04300 [Termitinemataceae bacterium]